MWVTKHKKLPQLFDFVDEALATNSEHAADGEWEPDPFEGVDMQEREHTDVNLGARGATQRVSVRLWITARPMERFGHWAKLPGLEYHSNHCIRHSRPQ